MASAKASKKTNSGTTKFHGWQGCPLINPLCPDDLCVLKPGHDGLHHLMTAGEPYEVSKIMFMSDKPIRKSEKWYSYLIAKGESYWLATSEGD